MPPTSTASTRGAAAQRDLPLSLCYVVFPLSNVVAQFGGGMLWRNWIDVGWVLLAVAAAVGGEDRAAVRQLPVRLGPLFTICACLATWLAVGVLSGNAPTVTGAMEVKPVFYLLVALLLARSGPAPTPEDFCRNGVRLSIILIAETLVRSVLAGGLDRPIGSGEVNYDAALLCLSLVFALGRRDLARRYGPLVFLGLLATFSRTSLAAACVVLLFASAIPLTLRTLMAAAAIGAATLSFVIRGLELGALESMDRYWMWFVGIEHLMAHPSALMLIAAPGSGIDVEIPRFLFQLWTEQQEKLDIEGVFPFHFHAMWLRLAMAWGWLPVAALLVWVLHVLLLPGRRPAPARALGGASLVLGLTMGLLYLGNVAVPFLLAAFQLLPQRRRVRGRVRQRPVQPVAAAWTPAPEHLPTRP